MSQAEELLNTLADAVPEHTHAVTDTDTYFVIDPNTRQIENTNRNKSVIMQYDHNSERFTFQLPRYIDGHDMMQCTSVIVNFDNIDAETGNTYSDICDMSAVKIDPAHIDRVITSWLITRNATQLAGALNFSIEFKCTDYEGNVVYEWSTDTYDRIEVKPRSKNNAGTIVEHEDILEQWRVKIFGAGDSVMSNIAAEGEAQVEAVKTESATQQEAVELKGSNTLASIPEDYTGVNNKAEDAVRSKSNAIVCEAEGSAIAITDSADNFARGMNLFGKSTQTTTTGKQLANNTNTTYTVSGITFTTNPDGSISIKGTSTGLAYYIFDLNNNIPIKETPLIASLTGSEGVSMVVGYFTEQGTIVNEIVAVNSSISKTFKYPAEAVLTRTFLSINSGKTINATVYPMIRLATVEDTAYEPYTGGMTSPSPAYPQEIVSIENPKIDVIGKNLIKYPYYEPAATKSGVKITVNPDGTILLNGTPSAATSFICAYYTQKNIFVKRGQRYSFRALTTVGSLSTLYAYISYNGRTPVYDVGYGATLIPEEDGYVTVCLDVAANAGQLDNVVIKPQLELGEASTEYEPYNVQRLAINRTLPGIPVSEGGNYTDENGQQWICDEVDLERGVYVQRVKEIVLSSLNKDTWYTWGVSKNTAGVTGFYHYFTDPVISDIVMSNIGSCNAKVWGGVSVGVGASWKSKYLIVSVDNDVLDDISTDVNATESFKNMLSTTNAKMLVVIEPTERPLTADEIEAFKVIRTNRPYTTILNDAGAWMSVKYNADTKTYVENPKILKLVDSSTGVVYELKIVDGNLTVVPV